VALLYDTGESVNLTRYRYWINRGRTPKEAAFKTWSGKQAKEYGFTEVEVTEIETGIQATFTKPN